MLMIIFCVLAILALILWLKWVLLLKNSSGPISSGCIPIIGHTHKLLGNTEKLWKFIADLSNETNANGGVIRAFVAMRTYYVVTDPDDMLTVGNQCLEKHYSFDFAKPWVGDGLVTGTTDIWRRHRKLLNPSFTTRILHGFMDIFNTQARELVFSLAEQVDKGPVDVSSYFRTNAMKALRQTVFGISGISDDHLWHQYNIAVDKLLELIVSRFQNAFLQSNLICRLIGLKKTETELIKGLNDMSNDVIEKKRAARIIERDTPSTAPEGITQKLLLDIMLELSEDNQLTDREIREEVDTFLLAGTDTSSWLVHYIVAALGTYPDVQKKVIDEMTQVFGNSNREVDKDDLQKLIYTEAVIKETLRLYPVVPLTIRNVESGIQLKTVYLKPGDYVLMSFLGVNRHPMWGPDVDQFRPERWLGDVPNAFGGFGIGKRNCIGKMYAMISMKVLLVHVLRRYSFTGDISALVQKMDFIGKPVRGHHVTITKRSSALRL